MLKQPTTFIVGAGASCEFGMPDGRQLAKRIAADLDIRYEAFNSLIRGDSQIAESLRRGSATSGWQQACWRISKGLPLADSIDNYLDNHQNDAEMQQAGRIAIVKSILSAEQRCRLYHNPDSEDGYDFQRVEATWLPRLFKLLQRGRPLADINRFFDNCRMVIFNYDRCVEAFFVRGLVTYYHVSEDTAQSVVASAPFYHVYGSVGALPGLSPNRSDIVNFGSTAVDLFALSRRIRTYSDHSDDERLLLGVGESLVSANLLVFLGFSYNAQNVKLLAESRGLFLARSGSASSTSPALIGSTFGLSDFNVANIRNDLIHRLSPHHKNEPELRGVECGALIEQCSTAF